MKKNAGKKKLVNEKGKSTLLIVHFSKNKNRVKELLGQHVST
jgi:hypothetical protein